MLKKNLNNIYKFFLIISVYFTHVWINAYYYANNNVDFSKYFDYLNYFLGHDVDIDYGQGSLYYYLNYLSLSRNLEIVNIGNLTPVLSASIHEINLLIYIVGLIGLYKTLELYEFQEELILITLIAFTFFPQSIYMRSVMKPEIFAFSLFVWSIFFVEKYIKSKDIKNIFFSIPFLALLINTKASIAAMTVVYFLISYFKLLKLIKPKLLLIVFLTFIVLSSIILFENYSITGLLPIDRVYEEEFDYKADKNILFRFNIFEVITQPFFKYDYQTNFYSIHAKSVINLTLLDTFGDHFNQLFDYSGNYFSKHRKDVFVSDSETILTKSRQINYSGPFAGFVENKLDHFRKLLSVLFSLVFYLIIFFLSYKDKRVRKFYLAPIVGIFVLYLNAIGIPANNFNPFKGDTFKAFYYVPLLSVSFCFLIIRILKNNKIFFNLILTTTFILSILFIGGHPKANSQELSERLVANNEFSVFCEINNLIFFENRLIKKIHPSGNIYGYKSDCSNFSTSEIIFKNNNLFYSQNNEEGCKESGKLIREKSNTNTCRIFWIKEVDFLENNSKLPYFSIILYILTISLVLKESVTYAYYEKSKKFFS